MKRTSFCQSIIDMNFGLVALEAIQNGFDGSLERIVAKSLKHAVKRGESEAEVIPRSSHRKRDHQSHL